MLEREREREREECYVLESRLVPLVSSLNSQIIVVIIKDLCIFGAKVTLL